MKDVNRLGFKLRSSSYLVFDCGPSLDVLDRGIDLGELFVVRVSGEHRESLHSLFEVFSDRCSSRCGTFQFGEHTVDGSKDGVAVANHSSVPVDALTLCRVSDGFPSLPDQFFRDTLCRTNDGRIHQSKIGVADHRLHKAIADLLELDYLLSLVRDSNATLHLVVVGGVLDLLAFGVADDRHLG